MGILNESNKQYKMTELQKKFIDLAVVQLKKYDEISEILGVEKKELSVWWKELKEEREAIAKVKSIWLRKFKNTNFWTFYNWYISQERKCYYCNITEFEIKILLDKDHLHTKRLRTRGKSLEIERIKPEESYDNIENLTFCCYWCNNAKTDTFSENEFIEVGKVFSKIWQQRLKMVKEK